MIWWFLIVAVAAGAVVWAVLSAYVRVEPEESFEEVRRAALALAREVERLSLIHI